jgi:hypothetical protein
MDPRRVTTADTAPTQPCGGSVRIEVVEPSMAVDSRTVVENAPRFAAVNRATSGTTASAAPPMNNPQFMSLAR